jgi:membrane complex biogenesis BtpA family protein
MQLARTLIGMVHLLPLPGSARWAGSMTDVVDAALADARALVDNGMDALLVENHGDAPFTTGRVDASAVAAMAVAADAIRRAIPHVPLGINVLKNDARSALGIAIAVGAAFVRVNVHAGAVLADQGVVHSDAHGTLRERRLLGADRIRIFADVQGKHAVPLAPVELEQEARDLVHRGLADALIVTGRATGDPTPLGDVKRVRGAVPDVPVLVGSGVTPEAIAETLSVADAVIVGTSVKHGGDVRKAVDPARVRRLVAAAGR